MKLLNADVSFYAAVITSIIFLFLFKKLSSSEKIVAAVILTHGCIEVTAVILALVNNQNIWFYNIAVIMQATIFSYAMLKNMQASVSKKVLIIGISSLLLLHVLNIIWYQGIHNFANFTFIPICTWLAVIAYYFLKEEMEYIERNPFDSMLTWLALATLIDNAGAMPILTILGWPEFLNTPGINLLYSLVTWLYAFWFIILIFGLLWTKILRKSVSY